MLDGTIEDLPFFALILAANDEDSWNATQLATQLEGDGFEMVAFGQDGLAADLATFFFIASHLWKNVKLRSRYDTGAMFSDEAQATFCAKNGGISWVSHSTGCCLHFLDRYGEYVFVLTCFLNCESR